ncbi:DUF805 domain-containing protein [Streptomyces sp. G45]|uniref:DUF805 domain-containing protein n=1 Tax=Streptomyces sp. G45 TaxID=3406627 RepID=UPI003C1C1695
MHWYGDVLKKYAVFEGRARRAEYWMFTLISLVISVALMFADMALGLGFALEAVYAVAVLLPGLAVGVRRLHDTGRGGWWLLLSLVPLVGWIVLVVLLAQDSAPPNQYGPNPKEAAPASVW